MRIGDEATVAAEVRARRIRRGLSQAALAELAGVSAKTVQRLEAGQAIAGSSRRDVLAALDIDPDELTPPPGPSGAAPGTWKVVADATMLLAAIGEASSVEVHLDRQGWREARENRPWYKQDIVVAWGDPTHLILEAIDRADTGGPEPPGRAARQQDALDGALRAARAMRWALAMKTDEAGCLRVYLGSPEGVAERAGDPAPSR